jgi:hypothetical protein
MTRLERIREAVGRVWGASTTYVLAFSVAVLPVLQGIDPDLMVQFPAIKWAIAVIGLAAAVARVLAPPPPSVKIRAEDAVMVDREAGVVTIAKGSGKLPDQVADKAAGEPVS